MLALKMKQELANFFWRGLDLQSISSPMRPAQILTTFKFYHHRTKAVTKRIVATVSKYSFIFWILK